MFDSKSRYANVDTLEFQLNGRMVQYKKRRFIKALSKFNTFQEIDVSEGDRLDLIAYQKLGNPELFWKICDTNRAMHPLELTDEIGKTLKISNPLE